MEESIHIRSGWLIDGSGQKALSDQLISIENDRIQSIRKSEGSSIPHADSVDCSRHTVLPGLIDSHVHLFMSGTGDRKIREDQLDAPYEKIKPVIIEHIKGLLRYGVVAVRDGGDRHAHTLRFKNESLEKDRLSLCIHAAGRAWHKPNRYGRLIGRAPAAHETLANAIMADSEAKDHVKIVNSGLNSLINFGRQTPPQFDLKELKDAVQASNHKGWPVMVHANGEMPVGIAINAGCRSIEHGFFMGKENLKKLAEKQIFWIPTAFTMKAFADHFNSGGSSTDVPLRNMEHQLEQMAMARKFGVPIALGTDAGSPGVHHGSSMIEELKLLMDAGFSVEEAIRCATGNGAKVLEIENLGRLVSGADASFIVVPGPPSHLPESLRSVQQIYVNGRLYPQDYR
ncbi:MAG TPA: amidohydrolase family protein [Deltaproteobacteria bacterium]|nr:amidohydrolase family protein [Deltaproteobacteria bacterium]